MAGAPASWRQRLLAACLAAGEGAVASHRAAAVLWRLAGIGLGVIEISVARDRRVCHRGMTVHRVGALDRVDITSVDGIPTTTATRTLLDLAGVVHVDVIEEALDDALRRGLTSISRLRWRLTDIGGRGRPGIAVIRRLLDARTEGAGIPQSVLETRLLRLIRRAHLPAPSRQHRIRIGGRVVAVVDFAYPDVRLAIEADGYRWHSGRARWEHDLARRNELTKLGWRVIHVTARDLERRPQETVRTIAEALGDAAERRSSSKRAMRNHPV